MLASGPPPRDALPVLLDALKLPYFLTGSQFFFFGRQKKYQEMRSGGGEFLSLGQAGKPPFAGQTGSVLVCHEAHPWFDFRVGCRGEYGQGGNDRDDCLFFFFFSIAPP